MSGREATGAAATLAARGQLQLAQRFRHAEKVRVARAYDRRKKSGRRT
jgi:hypothetical protein